MKMSPEIGIGLFQSLQDASPLLVVTFAIMWLVHKILYAVDAHREDRKYTGLKASLKEYKAAVEHKEDKIVEGLNRMEAVLIQHSATHDRCQYICEDDLSDSRPSVMSLQNQKTMIQYQWKWCKDEFTSIIRTSILKNGIFGREEVVSRRVVNAWVVAAKEAKESLDRLEGMKDYNYTRLFGEAISSLIVVVWKWAIPLYHRDTCDLEASLDDLSIRIKNLFDSSYEEFMGQQEDPDTGGVYRRKSEVGQTSGEHLITEEMSEQLRVYQSSQSSSERGSNQVRSSVK